MAAQNSDMAEQSLFTSMAQAEKKDDMRVEYARMAMQGKLSDSATALWKGDFYSVRKMFENLGGDSLKQKLEEKETKLKLTAIHHVMEGMSYLRQEGMCAAEWIPGPVFQSVMPAVKCRDHKKVLDKLILLGADVNARDAAGYTPLFIAAVAVSDLASAEALLKAGADPNLMNRCGGVPLFSSVMKEPVDLDMVQLLVKYGADQNIRTSGLNGSMSGWTGMSVREVVEQMGGREMREILKILDKKPGRDKGALGGQVWETPDANEDNENSDEEEESEVSDLKEVGENIVSTRTRRNVKMKCYRASCVNMGEHRCSRCRRVVFCSQECSDQHWPTHREECKTIRAARGAEYELAHL